MGTEALAKDPDLAHCHTVCQQQHSQPGTRKAWEDPPPCTLHLHLWKDHEKEPLPLSLRDSPQASRWTYACKDRAAGSRGRCHLLWDTSPHADQVFVQGEKSQDHSGLVALANLILKINKTLSRNPGTLLSQHST